MQTGRGWGGGGQCEKDGQLHYLLIRTFLLAAAVFYFLLPGVFPARALEGGGSHYYGGNEDFGAGSWPPHGL